MGKGNSKAKFIIGIDLGTTNSTLSYMDLEAREGDQPSKIETMAISQSTARGTVEELLSLPSFIYFPLAEENESGNGPLIGTYARDRGAEVAGRVIASAKSWLCHDGVDRREPFLPLNHDSEMSGMSPVGALAEILGYLKDSWNQKMGEEGEFGQQKLLITVPASFDPSARELIQEAATIAGYPKTVVLIEEPQAAFYHWLNQNQEQWRKKLQVGDRVLVVDIGGGTTDFSMIEVREEGGDLHLERISVGSHLLLGGDNMDYALAFLAKQKLEGEGKAVSTAQFQAMVHSCRKAKESLLGENPPKQADVTLLGRGRGVVGGTVKTQISLEEAFSTLIEPFFPLVPSSERSLVEKRVGLRQLGLPFAQDGRVTCQMAKFLASGGDGALRMPTKILFNGGTLKAKAIRDRIVAQLNLWAEELGEQVVEELDGADLDFAVSRGATFYGLAREGKAIRVRGGISRNYFIGVEEAIPAIPGFATPLQAVCVAPFGMEEGTELELEGEEFSLILGENASFRFFESMGAELRNGEVATVGAVVRNWKEELTELHPVESSLAREEGDGRSVNVRLKSKVTELGVLELWFFAQDGREWKLEFNLREEKVLVGGAV